MTDREIIHEYLKSLSKYLSRLDKGEVDEVIREIESHIYDALDAKGENGHASEILEGFGPPRELAASYVDHVLQGTPPPIGFKAIKFVKKGVSKGLYYSTGALGYFFASTLILIGLIKLLLPEIVGIWATPHGNSIIVGFGSEIPEGLEEIVGWWIIPVVIVAGLSVGYMTKSLLTILKGKL